MRESDYDLPRLIRKLLASLREQGLIATAKAVDHMFRYRIERFRFGKAVLALDTPEERFTEIYLGEHWQGEESASGKGSTLDYTHPLRAKLPELIARYKIKSVFDGPCGDFNWMSQVLDMVEIKYVGGDIVEPMISRLQKLHTSADISFLHMDLTRDPFPSVDLMICRDCLFHLSYADTELVLRNFLKAEIPFLLTTTHPKDPKGGSVVNKDIVSGDFRFIDLFAAPYNFPGDPLEVVDDWVPGYAERYMVLWNRDQVERALLSFSNRPR